MRFFLLELGVVFFDFAQVVALHIKRKLRQALVVTHHIVHRVTL